MIRATIYADCDSETAESIIRNAFKPYEIEIDISLEDVTRLAAIMGRAGGQSTSEAKQAASRANGKRGGRPRKQRGYDMTNSGFKTIKVGDIVIYKGHRLPQYNGCEARVTAIDHKLNQATLALPDKHVALVTSDQIEK